ncbi:hypothetical protein COHA_002790 [Chlorella ohadii]|uniref:Uncharacterized protein n=1 Tax=Chlorella ohadii TaxID=2649997 RepID=A0AAD5DVZ1_9CHLO|nr:hypothetical protein COHA_002790 [Chlorella ohadii]
MASTRNAYEALLGGGAPAANSAGAAKKKKNKKKGGAGAAGEAQAAAAPAAAPVAAPVAAPARPQVQSLRDAAAALEAAAVAAQAGERGSLAQDWADQVFNSDALFADGAQLADFKQVLLKSRAVELLLDGCLSKGAFPFEAEPLAALLSAVAHPSVPRDYCHALATAACALGAVSTTDPLAPAPAAKRSAAAALALALKGIPKPPPAKPAEAPAAKLKRLGGELGRQEARLPATSAPKELCKVYSSILELLCGQLDVLRPGGGAAAAPAAPELAAALKPLDELRAALEARLQEATAPKKPALSVEEQVAEAEAGYKKEEAASAARLATVEARIRDLEAELAAAKAEAGDLRARRASAAQHHTLRLQQIRSGKTESGASPEEIAAAVQGGLGAVEGLAAAVRSGGAPAGAADAAPSDAAALAQAVVAAEVPVKLLGAMQQVVELSIAQLHELGGKAAFFRERLDKSIKQGEQAAKLGVGDPKLFAQQRTMAEKNVKEVLAAAEAAAAAARAAVASYRERLPVLLRLPSFLPPPPEYLAALEGRAAEAEQLLASAGASGAPLASAAGDLASLEARLAALEEENSKKDAQVGALAVDELILVHDHAAC